mgnify:FL=1
MTDPKENFKIKHCLTDVEYQELYEYLVAQGTPDLYAAYIAENSEKPLAEFFKEVNTKPEEVHISSVWWENTFSAEFNELLCEELCEFVGKPIESTEDVPLTVADAPFQAVATDDHELRLQEALGFPLVTAEPQKTETTDTVVASPEKTSLWHKVLNFFNKIFD